MFGGIRMTNEEFQRIVLEELSGLREGQRSLEEGQSKLEEGQTRLELRQGKLESRQNSMEKDIKEIKNVQKFMWEDIKKLDNRLGKQEEKVRRLCK